VEAVLKVAILLISEVMANARLRTVDGALRLGLYLAINAMQTKTLNSTKDQVTVLFKLPFFTEGTGASSGRSLT
jgi:hypothetical protein